MEISIKNIPNLLKKRVFTRQNVETAPSVIKTTSSQNDVEEVVAKKQNLLKISQDQFLRELDPNSHDINNVSIFPNKVKRDEDGSVSVTFVSRVSVALQKFIANRQSLHQLANPVILTKSRKTKEDLFIDFKEFWRFSSIDSAMLQALQSAKSTGDGAIYFFFDDDRELNFKCWSYKDGDVLIPHYKPDGVTLDAFSHRYFSVDEEGQNVDTLEVYDSVSRYIFVQDDKDGWFQKSVVSHGFGRVPVAYHRENDVAWANVQDLIDKLERALSDYRDSNAYFTYGMLFIKGTDVNVLPDKDTQGKVIISEDTNSDVKLIEQSSVAKGFEWEFEKYLKTTYEQTGTVVIDPKDFKGGDVSGATVRNYYDPAIQQAKSTEPLLQPFLKQVIAVMKVAYGISESKSLDVRDLKIKADLDIYVPRNISEEITLINQSASMGSLSKRTASEMNKYAKSDEYERILKEVQDNLIIETNEKGNSTGDDGVGNTSITKAKE